MQVKEERAEVILEDFKKHVNKRKKDGSEILNSLTPEKCDMLHMAVGTSTEANELLDAFKKHVIYGKELDVVNVREELGDLLFYMQGIANILDIDMLDILKENIDKLEVRYPDGYTDKNAIARLDKVND